MSKHNDEANEIFPGTMIGWEFIVEIKSGRENNK